MRSLAFIIICYILIVNSDIYAQNTFSQSLDSNYITIGDALYLTQKASKQPKPDELINQLQSLEWFQILDPGSWLLTPNQWYERRIKFSVYDSGYYVIPPLDVRIDSQTITSNPIPLQVVLAFDSISTIQPIKDIIRTETPSYLIYYIAGGILLTLLLLFLLILLFKADQVRIKRIHYNSAEFPHEMALNELKLLENKKLWQAGNAQQHYDELTYLLRRYLNEGFHIPALESSTSDLKDSLTDNAIILNHSEEFQNLLSIADYIKFAKKDIPIEEHSRWMKLAYDFINSNKDKSIEFLKINKSDYVNILGPEIAAQFEYPKDLVPDTLKEILTNHNNDELVLISNLTKLHKFNIPQDWLAYHNSKLGQLAIWHLNILQKYKGLSGRALLLALLIPVALFLPFMFIISLLKKENLFQRGIFTLSRIKKLLVNESLLN